MIKKMIDHKNLLICLGLSLLIIGLAMLMLTQMVSKDIKLVVDGETTACETNSLTVEEFLKEKDIDLVKEDSISPSVNEYLTDGGKIEIIKAVPFTVQADGKTKSLKAIPDTVGDVLAQHDISVGAADKVSPGLNKTLTAGTEVVINRITKETKDVTVSVDFKTKTTDSNDLAAGTSKVVKEGVKGKDKVTYEITYSDGKAVDKKEVKRTAVKEPVTKVIAKGTRGSIEGAEYKKKFTVKAYSYSGGGTTASGTKARVGAIAVDPSVIPLGTKVYVEGYGFATAEDTGGNIKGNTIDVYKNSESECLSWGVRNVNIYILY